MLEKMQKTAKARQGRSLLLHLMLHWDKSPTEGEEIAEESNPSAKGASHLAERSRLHPALGGFWGLAAPGTMALLEPPPFAASSGTLRGKTKGSNYQLRMSGCAQTI